jgi:hypothetical protein
MTLPHETEVTDEIAAKYRVQLDAMTKLHDAVVAMMSAGSWTRRNTHGLNPVVVQTMMGLLEPRRPKRTSPLLSFSCLCRAMPASGTRGGLPYLPIPIANKCLSPRM